MTSGRLMNPEAVRIFATRGIPSVSRKSRKFVPSSNEEEDARDHSPRQVDRGNMGIYRHFATYGAVEACEDILYANGSTNLAAFSE